MKKIVMLSTLLTVFVGASAVAAESNSVEQKNSSSGAVEKLVMAAELARLGIQEKDPLLLISAAKLRLSVPITQQVRSKSSEGESNIDAEGSGQLMTVTAMLEAATRFSGSNESYLSLIESVQAISPRGRLQGAVSHTDRVKANKTDVYKLDFKGRELAQVGVIGDGDTDLDLYIYDENGNEICVDDDASDLMICEWTPRWSGEFTIKIKNLGDVYNEYYLETN